MRRARRRDRNSTKIAWNGARMRKLRPENEVESLNGSVFLITGLDLKIETQINFFCFFVCGRWRPRRSSLSGCARLRRWEWWRPCWIFWWDVILLFGGKKRTKRGGEKFCIAVGFKNSARVREKRRRKKLRWGLIREENSNQLLSNLSESISQNSQNSSLLIVGTIWPLYRILQNWVKLKLLI